MRTSFFFFLLAAAILLITGCEKDPGEPTPTRSNPVLVPPPPPPGPGSVSNDSTPPRANAGSDVLVLLPADSCGLYGGASYRTNSNINYKWRKISGPSSIKIINPDLPGASAKDLTQGIYELELTVTDNAGLMDTDTMSVIVGVMSTREHSIKNVSWSSEGAFGTVLWGAILTVKNIYSLIPVGSVFKVFVKKETSVSLVEAIGYWSPGSENALYTFSIFDSNLHIWSGDEEIGKADIMIVY